MPKHAKKKTPENSKHDRLCPNFTGPCCPWVGDCTCQCMCDFINEVRDDERSHTQPQKLTESTITYVNASPYTAVSTYTVTETPVVCEYCKQRCWEPLPMSKRARRIYDALFGSSPHHPLHWDETDDCDSRVLMREIAEAAARASKKGR
jgi:hypothetical protein